MGKLKRKKLTNALDRLLDKNAWKAEKERKAKALADNLEKAKRNQVKAKRASSDTLRTRPQLSSKDKILLVGEGNFSFARSLAENYLEEGSDNMIATCYDTEQVLYQKYEDAKDNVEFIREYGATVLFEVDATDLSKEVKKNRYTKIIFNFPHAGAGIKDQDRNVVANQKLLNAFFDSAAPLLTKASQGEIPATKSESRQVEEEIVPDGEIHVALKTCQPYNLWAIKSLVKAKGVLAVKGTAPFYPDDYPGYEHRRTLGFKKGTSVGKNAEIVSAQPKNYIFVRKEVMDKENENSIKGSLKRQLEQKKLKMGKKVKRKKVQHNQSDDDE